MSDSATGSKSSQGEGFLGSSLRLRRNWTQNRRPCRSFVEELIEIHHFSRYSVNVRKVRSKWFIGLFGKTHDSHNAERSQRKMNDIIKKELVSGLRRIFKDKLICVYLYGSVARNEQTPESDVDIAFIVRSGLDNAEKAEFLHWNAEIDLRFDLVFSIVDIDEETFAKWNNTVPFYKTIKQEGIVLWKAA